MIDFLRESAADWWVWVLEDWRGESRMARWTFSDEQREVLRRERFVHPPPRVHQRMELLWYVSLGETYSQAARLAGVS